MAHLHASLLGQSRSHTREAPGAGAALVRGPQAKRLWIVLGFTAAFMVADVVGGILSNSLALLADSGHMLADVGALALSLIAMRLGAASAQRRAYVRIRPYGDSGGARKWGDAPLHQRVDRLGGRRTPRCPTGGRRATHDGRGGSGVGRQRGRGRTAPFARPRKPQRAGAYLHVLGDLLGSIGAIGAGALILLTGWTPIDAIVSVVIVGLILLGAWRLVREATGVLLEMVPPHVDMGGRTRGPPVHPNVHHVHDLHVWTLTSGFVALSGHGVWDDPTHHQRVLDEIRDRMELRGIGHVTFQLEPERLHQIVPPDQTVDRVR